MRIYAGMGPGELKANIWGDPHCGSINDNFPDAESKKTYQAIMNPPNYMSKAMWLPPGTPDHIADALSMAFQKAFAEDAALNQKYGAIAGESPKWTDRVTGTKMTQENEDIFEESLVTTKREGDRLIAKYFPQYVSN